MENTQLPSLMDAHRLSSIMLMKMVMLLMFHMKELPNIQRMSSLLMVQHLFQPTSQLLLLPTSQHQLSHTSPQPPLRLQQQQPLLLLLLQLHMLPHHQSMHLLQFMPQLQDQSMSQLLNQFMHLLLFMLQLPFMPLLLPFTQLKLQQPQPQPPPQLLLLHHQLQSIPLHLLIRPHSLPLLHTSQHLLMVPHNVY